MALLTEPMGPSGAVDSAAGGRLGFVGGGGGVARGRRGAAERRAGLAGRVDREREREEHAPCHGLRGEPGAGVRLPSWPRGAPDPPGLQLQRKGDSMKRAFILAPAAVFAVAVLVGCSSSSSSVSSDAGTDVTAHKDGGSSSKSSGSKSSSKGGGSSTTSGKDAGSGSGSSHSGHTAAACSPACTTDSLLQRHLRRAGERQGQLRDLRRRVRHRREVHRRDLQEMLAELPDPGGRVGPDSLRRRWLRRELRDVHQPPDLRGEHLRHVHGRLRHQHVWPRRLRRLVRHVHRGSELPVRRVCRVHARLHGQVVRGRRRLRRAMQRRLSGRRHLHERSLRHLVQAGLLGQGVWQPRLRRKLRCVPVARHVLLRKVWVPDRLRERRTPVRRRRLRRKLRDLRRREGLRGPGERCIDRHVPVHRPERRVRGRDAGGVHEQDDVSHDCIVRGDLRNSELADDAHRGLVRQRPWKMHGGRRRLLARLAPVHEERVAERHERSRLGRGLRLAGCGPGSLRRRLRFRRRRRMRLMHVLAAPARVRHGDGHPVRNGRADLGPMLP